MPPKPKTETKVVSTGNETFLGKTIGSVEMFESFRLKYSKQGENSENTFAKSINIPDDYPNFIGLERIMYVVTRHNLFRRHSQNLQNSGEYITNCRFFFNTIIKGIGLIKKHIFSEIADKNKNREKWINSLNDIIRETQDDFIRQEYNRILNIISGKSDETKLERVRTASAESTFNYQEMGYKKYITTVSSYQTFLSECERIGKKLNTGSLLIQVNEMMQIYINGLTFLKNKHSNERLNFQTMYNNYKEDTVLFLKYIFKNLEQNLDYTDFGQDATRNSWIVNFLGFIQKIENRNFINILIDTKCSMNLQIAFDGKSTFSIGESLFNFSIRDTAHFFGIFDPYDSKIERTGIKKYEKDYKIIANSDIDEFRLYFWQRDAVTIAKNNESFIIWGDTSGGKTHVLMLIIIDIIMRTDDTFIYCAPTDQLAMQTFSNIIATLKGYQNKEVAIIIDQITYVPENAKIFVGTPKELADFFSIYERRQTFVETLNTRRTKPTVRLAVDECHTMAKEYNPSESGKKAAKSIYNLITGLKDSSENVQFIGMSASLSDESFEACRNSIIEASGISNLRLIKYTRATAKLYEAPEEEPQAISNQTEFNVGFSGGILSNQELPEKIEVTNLFFEKLIFKMIEDVRTPSAIFFETEAEAIIDMKNFIDYLKFKDRNSKWAKAKEERHTTTLTLKEFIIQKIKEISRSDTAMSVECSQEYFRELISFYNSKNSEERLVNPVYSIDLYAMLYEYKKFENKEGNFNTEVHPMFNFGGYKRIENSIDFSGDFGRLITEEGINSQNNRLVETLRDGMKYGIGLVTSSIPIAFQLQISKILMGMKKNPNGEGIKFIFSDYSLSMGIDYPLSSTAIINKDLKPITIGEKKQKAGRAGRNDEQGNYIDSTVYFVNVSNYSELSGIENLSFDMSNITSQYYSVNEIGAAINLIIKSEESTILQKIDTSYLNERSALFPNIILGNSDIVKYKYMKQCIRELFDISKVIFPTQTVRIQRIYNYIKIKIYNILIG